MSRLTVCSFWWRDPAVAEKPRYAYTPEHVIIHRAMIQRRLSLPHDYVCITDCPQALPGDINTIPLDRTTFLPRTRYAKLMLFRKDIADLLGPRILYMDLDSVVVAAFDPIVDRPEPLVLYRNPHFGSHRRTRFNTSMMLLSAGVHPSLYHAFDPQRDPERLARRWGGTDQAWISHKVDHGNPAWDASDGVYHASRPGSAGVGRALPANARVVFFPGPREPSMAEVNRDFPWLSAHWHA